MKRFSLFLLKGVIVELEKKCKRLKYNSVSKRA